jgi:diguanylate cyclase (GGDEF)-like protein/PAS domain S-box-containing protein
MHLSRRAQFVVVSAVLAAALSVADLLYRYRADGIGSAWVVGIITAFVLVSWIWPIVMYLDETSQAHHLDEGFFLVLVLVVPPAGVLLAFFVTAALAQVIRRRPVVKSVFNVASTLLSVSAGIAVVRLLAPAQHHLSATSIEVGVLAAIVYFLVNSLTVAIVMAASGAERMESSLLQGFEIRALVLAAAIALGLVGAMAISAYAGSAIFVGLLFWAFRQALAGHFRARHDRTRLVGLFDATLDVHRTMGINEVTSALAQAASSLLRSPEVTVSVDEPTDGAMATRMTVSDSDRWLVLSGRNRLEPFDAADRALLDALGAVGSGALENSALYEERRRQQENLVAITSSLGEGVCALDASGKLTFMNPAAEELLGWSEQDAISDGHLSSDGHFGFLVAPALRAMRSNTTIRSERATFDHRNGVQFPVEYTCSPIRPGQDIEGAVVAFRDISERIEFEEQLAFHAFHDALTGLPNRRVFLHRLQHALSRSARTGAKHAVLFADVDRFKVANDSLGHRAGDQLLVVIAERLSALVREGDTLARFGGDEFTLLVEDIEDVAVGEEVASRMLELVRKPVVLETGRTVMVTVSVGIALATGGCSPDDALHDADVAMYQAKRKGADHYEVFDLSAMSARSAAWVDLEVELRHAVEHHELVVYYQPLFASDTLDVVGAEALVRWDHPQRGLVEPEQFISLAEEVGLIHPLGRYVLREACDQAMIWTDLLQQPFNISVNLSARQFQSGSLLAEIGKFLQSSGLQPSQLCLEITESLALQDIERSIATMSELKALGVRLAVDDFGTGYSSLSYLKRIPVDVVKLDRSFVQGLDVSQVDTAIVSAVVDLTRTIGMTTVAEGVETEGQLARLVEMGCPVLQGYLLARPMSAADFSSFLLARPTKRGPRSLRMATGT